MIVFVRITIRSPYAFVLMPFDTAFDDVYECGIKRACDEAGVVCVRVDEQRFRENIVERLYGEIARADLIIADMSGNNPNVFFEAGYARALNKATIYLSRGSDIPFDLRQYRHIIYGEDLTVLRERLREEIISSLHSAGEVDLAVAQADVRLMNRHGRCLDADLQDPGGLRVQQWSFHAGENQLWLIASCGADHFRISSKSSGKCLSIQGNAGHNGTPVVLWDYHGTPWQQWQFRPGDDGYRVVNRGSGKCLSVERGAREDGIVVIQNNDRAARDQRWWMFVNVSTPSGYPHNRA